MQAALYLVGDAGEDSPGRAAVLGHLYAELATLESDRPGLPIVVLFLGDNGTPRRAMDKEVFEAEQGKGTLYEGGIRTPLLAGGDAATVAVVPFEHCLTYDDSTATFVAP